MKLAQLTKPQWDAALEAAACMMRCDPNSAVDRAEFRDAKVRLIQMLPAGIDERDIITQAVRWNMLDALAESAA